MVKWFLNKIIYSVTSFLDDHIWSSLVMRFSSNLSTSIYEENKLILRIQNKPKKIPKKFANLRQSESKYFNEML